MSGYDGCMAHVCAGNLIPQGEIGDIRRHFIDKRMVFDANCLLGNPAPQIVFLEMHGAEIAVATRSGARVRSCSFARGRGARLHFPVVVRVWRALVLEM